MKFSCEMLNFNFKMLLFTGVLLVTIGQQATGLECYCRREGSIHTTGCTSSDTCSADVCYLRRTRSNGAIRHRWGCLDTSQNENWNSTCHINQENRAYHCCSSGDDCNRHLTAYFPSEIATTATNAPTEPSPTTVTQVPDSSSSTVVASRPPNGVVDPSPTPLPPSDVTTPTSSSAPTCYCNETGSSPSSSCVDQGYSCNSHSKCYTRRYFDEAQNRVHTKWACLSPTMPEGVCSGSMNNDKNVYKCCDGSNFCNRDLELVLPMEESMTTSTHGPSTASGSPGTSQGGVDIYIILTIVVVCLLIVVGVVVVGVLIFIYLRHQRIQADVAAAVSKQKRNSKRHLQLNGVIVNELGHSYSSVSGKTKSLNGLIS